MSVLKNPPPFRDDDDYEAWKNDIEMWSSVTDIKEENKAVIVHLSLTGKARKASSELKSSQLKHADGMKTLMAKLDRVFLQDPNWKCFNAYLAFENLRRDPNSSIDDYLSEFDSRYHKLKECDVSLPDAVVACRLLKSCNLSDVYFQLALSTTTQMTFEAMRATLKKLFTDTGNAGPGMSINGDRADYSEVQVKTEPAEAMYGNFRNTRGRGRGRPGRGHHQDHFSGNGDRRDNRCFNCGSDEHWVRYCPESRGRRRPHGRSDRNFEEGFYNEDSPEIALMTSAVCETEPKSFNADTIGHALLDSGCSKTVCGTQWYESFLETLSEKEMSQIKKEDSSAVFKFGDGKLFRSKSCITFPCVMNGRHITITTDVVECNIPLLLSRSSMKKAGMKINLVDDTAVVFEKRMKLSTTASGHYIVPIYRPPTCDRVSSVLLSCGEQDVTKTALKLHKQFAHPAPERLKKLLCNSGRTGADLLRAVEEVSRSCQTCMRYRKPHSKPIVSMPMSQTFNETVSMDLKMFDGVYFF